MKKKKSNVDFIDCSGYNDDTDEEKFKTKMLSGFVEMRKMNNEIENLELENEKLRFMCNQLTKSLSTSGCSIQLENSEQFWDEFLFGD
jgi:hypothetical protein